MLKILEACTYLAKLGLRSLGVFLVLHMVEKTSSEGSSELPDCVYSLHGIRTDAFWQSGLSEQIRSRTGFKVGYRNYLRFELLMFVLKNIFSYKPLHLIAGDIRDLQREHRVNVIAHSFGTWLLLKALSENGELRIHNLILCGAVFPTDGRLDRYGIATVTGRNGRLTATLIFDGTKILVRQTSKIT